MTRRILLHLHGETFARRYQIASHAITAAASGDEVLVVLWFDALGRWVQGRFDDAPTPEEAAMKSRFAALNLPLPAEMLRQARDLGARLVACETAIRLTGLAPSDARPLLDEIYGLQELLSRAAEADVVLYV